MIDIILPMAQTESRAFTGDGEEACFLMVDCFQLKEVKTCFVTSLFCLEIHLLLLRIDW